MNMSQITTLNQIVSWFQQYAEQHPVLKDFGYGATDAIGTTRAVSYPYMWISSTNSNTINISNHVIQPEFEFLVMVVDAISDQTQPAVENGWAATNEQDVLSDTYQILQDFIAWLNSSWRATGITISTALTAQPVYDTTPDRVSGWAVTVSLKIPYSMCVTGIDVNLPDISTNQTAGNAITASYAITAGTASYFSGSISNAVNSVNAISASYALTASYALNGGGGNIDTSSFITAAQTASMTVLSASYATTASYALNAGTTIDTGSFVTTSSFNSFTSSYYIASASFDTRIASASAKTLFPEIELGTATSQSGNWRLQPSSSALAFQYWDALNTVWVTDTLMTGTPMSGSGGAVASSSYAATSSWSAYSVTSSYSEYAVSASNALTASYSETSSYAFTSSYSVSASYSETASYALTASYVESSSYSLSSSFAVTSISASNALSAVTASHLLGTASNAVSASYSVTASWAPYQVSASYATTASYIDPAFISASAAASGFGSGGGGSTSGSSTSRSIGDYYQGGYIIQTYDNGAHGLILAAVTGSESQFKNNANTSILTWPYNNWTSSLNPFMFSSSIDASGYNMTNALRYSGVALGNGFAVVQLALDVDNSASFSGYSDWHLPGLVEADMIKSNILLLNARIIESRKSGSNHTPINHQFWLCHRPQDLPLTAYLFSPGQGYTSTPSYETMLTSTNVTATKPNRYIRIF